MMTFLVSVTLQDPKFGEVTFTMLIHDERVVVGDRSIQALETQRGLGDSLFALVNAYTVEIYPNRTLPHRLSYTLTDEDPSDSSCWCWKTRRCSASSTPTWRWRCGCGSRASVAGECGELYPATGRGTLSGDGLYPPS